MGLGKSKEPSSGSTTDNRRRSSGGPQRSANTVTNKNNKQSTADDGISASDRATLQLKLQRDKMHAVLRRSAAVLAREHEQAKQLLAAGHRDRALYCLKKKKLQESQMAHMEQLLDNIQASLDAIEFTRLEGHVFASLRDGTATLQALQKGMSPEEVERVMDDAFDAVAISKEVTDLLTARLGDEAGAAMLDDDALLEELLDDGVAATKVQTHDHRAAAHSADDAATTAKLLNSVALPSTSDPIGAVRIGQEGKAGQAEDAAEYDEVESTDHRRLEAA